MIRRLFAALIVASAMTASGPVRAQKPDPAVVMLEAARQKETLDGDLQGAIKQYQAIVSTYGKTNRAAAATALVRMAECYQKLGDVQARTIYEQLVRDYADQKDAVTLARSRLGRVDRSDAQRMAFSKVSTSGIVVTGLNVRHAVSADGRYMTHGGPHPLALRDLTTGADRPLTTGNLIPFNSAISKDSAQVAYNLCAGTRDHCEVRVASLQGTGVPVSRRLFVNDDVPFVAPMDWSPDGKSIAVKLERKDRTAQIGLIAVSDGALRVLKSVDWRGPTDMFFSPDGRDIAFDLPVSENSVERDAFVLAADGSREVTVAYPGDDTVMGWTPDGTRLLFASDRRNARGLWAQAFAGGKPQGLPELIKPDIGNVSPWGITRTGALYMRVGIGSLDVEVASIDLATGKQTAAPARLTQRFSGPNTQPAWSPDGKTLAYLFVGSFSRNGPIGIRSMDTGEIRELHLKPMLIYIEGLSWAPDGQSLVASGQDLKGREGIYRIDARSGEVVPIMERVPIPKAERVSPSWLSWSPDGSRMYYHSWSGTIRERNLTSGDERVLSAPESGLGPISVSPDGVWIASTRPDASTKSQTLVLLPIQGGQPRDLFRVSQPQSLHYSSMSWTPDGRAVLVRKMTSAGGDTSELWLLPIDGTAPRKLEFDANRVLPFSIGTIRLHPDGKQIAFVAGQPARREFWVLENFLPALKAKK